MSEPKDKRKFALWVREETMEKVEKLYRAENVKSRSEFIEKARKGIFPAGDSFCLTRYARRV